MSMYPDEETITIDGESVSYPGLKNGKFTRGNPEDPDDKPSFIAPETINLLVDNISAVISHLGGAPNNTSGTQLKEQIEAALLTVNPIKKMCTVLGITYDPTDLYQIMKLNMAISKKIGEPVTLEFFDDPVPYSAAQSTANPDGPEYFPGIPRHDGTHDVTTKQAPLLVTKLYNKKLSVFGYTEFTGTVSGSTVTVTGPSTTVRDALLAGIQAAAFVSRWYSSGESATFAVSGPSYSGARAYCANIGGTDCVISTVSTAAGTFGFTGTPPTGTQTIIIYPFRVAGYTDRVRLRQRSGFIPVAANDATGKILAGLDCMDELHEHAHAISVMGNNAQGTPGNNAVVGTASPATTGYPYTIQVVAANSGAARFGKNTSPRTFGVGLYTWVRTLLATDWSTAI